MKIESTRFGVLEVAEEQLIRFPHGIPGFPEAKTFIYLLHGAESPFSFLQSTTDVDLTFILADPFAFFDDYEFDLEDNIAEELELSNENPPQVFLIATVNGKLADMTVNLLAPIIINPADRLGRQIILNKPEYSISHNLFPNGLPQQAAEGGK